MPAAFATATNILDAKILPNKYLMKCLLFNAINVPYLPRQIGVYRIANFLREHDWDVEVIDWANFWTLDQLKELFRSRYSADLKWIGFSHLFTNWYDILEDFCEWVKQNYPEIAIVYGSSSMPEFNSKYIDYYIQGFGEYAILELLKYITGNGSRPQFMLPPPGGKKIINAVKSYPAFPMKSLMIKYQDRDFIEPDECLGIEFSRGCKFACDFCNFPVIGVKGDYTRDAEDFEIQIRETYERFGITQYTVVDDTFNDRTEKITKFADVVERLNFTPFFSGFVRADLLVSRPQDREELLRMNFLGHFYGVETFNHAAGKTVGKGMHPDRLKQGLIDVRNYFQSHGRQLYRGTVSLIVGLPHETVDSWNQTAQWMTDHWQGQSITLHPLMIWHPLSSVTPSKITMEYEKYGYKEMSTDQEPDNLEMIGNEWVTNKLIKWENPNMNYFQAQHLVENFVKNVKEKYDFRAGVFSLADRLITPHSVEEKLAYSETDHRQVRSRGHHIPRYIEKKLNYK